MSQKEIIKPPLSQPITQITTTRCLLSAGHGLVIEHARASDNLAKVHDTTTDCLKPNIYSRKQLC
ncbi:hypothetical protein E2C01_080784 [Portunus trituberculatus]|uniref:Uncharacterized protein n=1 Tax=Portunus trituberculatus TaxID=210409 RepID=A0A5B7IWA2_PORTR|nr:hypothetical protein [Portunus trituberculatus]